jgi:alpha,alpha-trehalase
MKAKAIHKAPSRGQRERQAARAPAPDRLSPADRYQELFVAVQAGGVFDDSKTFVDCAPRAAPAAILEAYRAEHRQSGFDLAAFVHRFFEPTAPPRSEYASRPGQGLCAHIDALWSVLTRHPRRHAAHASALQLPKPYVVPGGRFGELYYWDSYFTMLGLAASGRSDLLGDMVANFSYLIDTYGFVPNGTRSYYLSRSQPPVFALMLELAGQYGAASPGDHLCQLRQEHAFWMAGAHELAGGQAARRVVRLPGGALLNRYWDDRDTPREESWLEDVATARACQREPQDVYRNLRAAAESGWDFSSRWLTEEAAPVPQDHSERPARAASATTLTAICTTDLLPVDLNALLYKLETTLSVLSHGAGDAAGAAAYAAQAQARRAALHALCWNAGEGAFFDYDWRKGVRRRCLTAASLVPLFVGMAEQAQADALARTVARRLLAPGGLATTERGSDQQWDRPNGWAPLQWMGLRGLRAYGHTALADEIADRWLATVAEVYEAEGKLVEKYALREMPGGRTHGGGGGEYPLQDGFGWTNGVTRALLAEHPRHAAHRACARVPAQGA